MLSRMEAAAPVLCLLSLGRVGHAMLCMLGHDLGLLLGTEGPHILPCESFLAIKTLKACVWWLQAVHCGWWKQCGCMEGRE